MITAAAQGAGRRQEGMTSFYRDDLTGLPEMDVVARQLWRTSGLRPSDIDVGILYDHFTPFVLMQLEEFGFCKPGRRPISWPRTRSRSTPTAASSVRPTCTG